MRPAVIIIFVVLIGDLLAFDAYEYDGHYREAASDKTKHQAEKVERTVENWLERSGH